MQEELCLIDTNILVYAYSGTDERKSELAFELLEDCFDREESFAVCLQNLSEFFFVVTKHVERKLSAEDAKKITQDIIDFKGFKKIQYDENTLFRAMNFVDNYKVDFWDALIASTMIDNGIVNIYTENVKDFSKIPGINVVNPFV